VLAVLSAVSGHGSFSGGVAVMLGIYGAGLLAAGWGLWRLSIFSRGAIVAAALLHIAVIASDYIQGPLAWVAILLAVVPVTTVVATVWPSTTRALEARRAALQEDQGRPPEGESVPQDER
jgi:hypothetical protein